MSNSSLTGWDSILNNWQECIEIQARQGWQSFTPTEWDVGTISVDGTWTVDSRAYAPVDARGHTGADAASLAPYDQYKFVASKPFGELLAAWSDGTIIKTWMSDNFLHFEDKSERPKKSQTIWLRINDSDATLADNDGALTVCFSERSFLVD